MGAQCAPVDGLAAMQAWSFTYKTGVGFINSLASSALASQRFSLERIAIQDDYFIEVVRPAPSPMGIVAKLDADARMAVFRPEATGLPRSPSPCL